MILCKHCDPPVEVDRHQYFQHVYANHPDVHKNWTSGAGRKKGSKTKKSSSKSSDGTESSPSPQTSTKMADVVAPRAGAVVFTMGSLKIEVDPMELYESYALYADIKQKCGITDAFSTVLLDAMSMAWKLMVPRPTITVQSNVEGGNGTANGQTPERSGEPVLAQ